MSIISAFPGSGVELTGAGKSVLYLHVLSSDRVDMTGAVFTITATGVTTQTATADASGRATVEVDAGHTYTVALNYSSQSQRAYFNDEDQKVIAESGRTYYVFFDLVYDEYQELEFYSNQTASSWIADNTYADWPFRCAVGPNDLTSDDYAQVIFGDAEATSGCYSPVCQTFNGGVYIYSDKSDSITIPTILVKRRTT